MHSYDIGISLSQSSVTFLENLVIVCNQTLPMSVRHYSTLYFNEITTRRQMHLRTAPVHVSAPQMSHASTELSYKMMRRIEAALHIFSRSKSSISSPKKFSPNHLPQGCHTHGDTIAKAAVRPVPHALPHIAQAHPPHL